MLMIIRSKETAKLQWLQDPGKVTGGNQNNIRWKVSMCFRDKKRECLKDKTNELAMNNKD
jgi:hypothetical protein